ncbi:hypothetical protein V6N12_029127 [Hibiscus sabdariffa]|uniref:Reverse transcriptase zinc-binding domain-containing protein n=1 Tax=Hibiscus sabdariffa TaxID=183260 RepID=A0ABR1ZUW2_9ROSI
MACNDSDTGDWRKYQKAMYDFYQLSFLGVACCLSCTGERILERSCKCHGQKNRSRSISRYDNLKLTKHKPDEPCMWRDICQRVRGVDYQSWGKLISRESSEATINQNRGNTVRTGHRAVKEVMDASTSLVDIMESDWKREIRRNLCGLRLPSKIILFLWNIVSNNLSCDLEMRKSIRQGNRPCSLCHQEHDSTSLDHLFISCDFARTVWFGSDISLRVSNLPLKDVRILIHSVIVRNTWTAEEERDLPCNVASILWCIWRQRNKVCFSREVADPTATIHHAKELARHCEMYILHYRCCFNNLAVPEHKPESTRISMSPFLRSVMDLGPHDKQNKSRFFSQYDDLMVGCFVYRDDPPLVSCENAI